eukprot:scaffold3297_cov90-Isochrysis_galbana.AAC.5
MRVVGERGVAHAAGIGWREGGQVVVVDGWNGAAFRGSEGRGVGAGSEALGESAHLLQCRCVVDSVARHRCNLAQPLQLLEQALLRHRLGAAEDQVGGGEQSILHGTEGGGGVRGKECAGGFEVGWGGEKGAEGFLFAGGLGRVEKVGRHKREPLRLRLGGGGVQDADLPRDRPCGLGRVAGDHHHADARLPALLDSPRHLGPGGILDSYQAHERKPALDAGEPGCVAQQPSLGRPGRFLAVVGQQTELLSLLDSQGKAPERSASHCLELLRQPDAPGAVEPSPQRPTQDGHGLSGAGKLEGGLAGVAGSQERAVVRGGGGRVGGRRRAVQPHLLDEHLERRLRRFPDTGVDPVLVPDVGIVAQRAGGGQLQRTLAAKHSLVQPHHATLGGVGGALDAVLAQGGVGCGVPLLGQHDRHHRHLVGGERARLVRADDRGAACKEAKRG